MAVDSSSQRIDVFLFAENRLLRETLAKVLGKKSDLRIVGASVLDANICGRIADLKPHVLLFDSTVGIAVEQFPRFRCGTRGLPARRTPRQCSSASSLDACGKLFAERRANRLQTRHRILQHH
jgi:hypothetical protein